MLLGWAGGLVGWAGLGWAGLGGCSNKMLGPGNMVNTDLAECEAIPSTQYLSGLYSVNDTFILHVLCCGYGCVRARIQLHC